jgi:hypothetical protein
VENRQKLFTSEFSRIIYCQPESLAHRPNPSFKRLQKAFGAAELINGLPDISKLNLDLNQLPSLLIIDDQMNELLDSKSFVDLLCVKCHHFQICTIFTLQNYFASSKFGRTISRNVNYKVFFFNRVDLREIKNISMQISPSSPDFMQSNFNFLFEKFPNDPSHYIIVDGHYRSKMRVMYVRSRIFPNFNNVIEPIFFFPNPEYKK